MFIISLLIAALISTTTAATVERETSLGNVRGAVIANGTVSAFLGISYARDPSSSRRFAPPAPVLPWKPRVLDAQAGTALVLDPGQPGMLPPMGLQCAPSPRTQLGGAAYLRGAISYVAV